MKLANFLQNGKTIIKTNTLRSSQNKTQHIHL